jgi:leader peptidase (prepilin peptidase)/N-methyltransferase
MSPLLFILLTALSVAAWTDATRRVISNSVTYPALIGCLGASAAVDGWDGFNTSLLGGLVCGGLMLGCYLCVELGGGDVKLAAVIGAALGWSAGLYVLLWTFTLVAVVAFGRLMWLEGALRSARRLLERSRRASNEAIALANPYAPAQPMFVAPAALAAVILVVYFLR